MSTINSDREDEIGFVFRTTLFDGPIHAPVPVHLNAPVITPGSGTVPIDITITAGSGLQVIYTTNGTPASLVNGTVANSPALISLTAPCTVHAVTTDGTNVSDSDASATYNLGVVTFTPASGEAPLNVVITSPTTNLIYTVDGTTPTISHGTVVASPATLNLLVPCTVRAVSTDGTYVSAARSGVYVYTGRVGDPRLVPGLIAWYRSDSVAVTSGLVSTWYDQSGNTLHATPHDSGFPEGGVGPTLVNNVVNGLPVVRFDGVHSFLEAAYQNFGQPDTFFIVAKQSSKATPAQFISTYGDSHNRNYCDTSGHYTISGDFPTVSFVLSDSIDHSGAFHNFESIWDGASSAGWVDGELAFTGNTYVHSPAQMLIGRDPTIEAYLTGDIAEIIRYAIPGYDPLSVSDRKWVEAYLANRYALPNAVPFSPGPLNIAGLAAWFKADALALSNGAEITSWVDSSENGYTAIKGTTGPAFTTNIVNGYPVARFAAGKWLKFSSLTATQPNTVIFVTKGQGYIISDHDGGFLNIINSTTAGLFIHAGAAIQDSINHTGAFHVFSISLAGASTKAYIDGALALVGNPLGSTINNVAIGAYDQSGTGATSTNDIAELMIYRRPLSDHERQEIETYLKVKYATP